MKNILRSCAMLAAAAFLAFLSAPARAEEAPEPSAGEPGAGSAPMRWFLEFSHGPLKRVLVDDGTGNEATYLYMTMKVKNPTSLAREWKPLVTAKVDTRPAAYVAGGYPNALRRIRLQEGNDALEAVEATVKSGNEGRLAPGASLDLVAVFGPVEPGWGSLRVEVHGLVNPLATLKVLLYGEQTVVLDLAYGARNRRILDGLEAAAKASGSEMPKPDQAEYRVVLERRARVINYKRVGDEFRPEDDLLEFVSEDWEVIGEPNVISKTVLAK